MKVASIFILHPDGILAPVFISIFPAFICDVNVTFAVDPISVVDTSVYVVVVPFHDVINSPALELEPLYVVYLQKADVNEPVG